MRRVRYLILVGVLLSCAIAASAQSFVLDLPLQSQRAVIEQRVGLTDITISYHRPLVNNRKVWGTIVPYGQVWRAGANENTTIQFTDPVMIEGKALDRGTYGLHMIPDQQQWTIIFSKNSTSWGSFTYDQAEDALRITVKPATTDFHEALTYDFDNPTADSSVITMRWEKVAVPFKVSVNVNEVVAQSLHRQLRGLAQYSWQGWDDAANYLLTNKGDLNEALKDSNQSIQVEERFDNLVTKSKVLDAMGQKDQAKASLDKALGMGTPIQLHMYARQLQAEKHPEEAYAIFRSNAQKHPDQWFVHSGLARIYCSQGDYDSAAKEMKLALAGAPEQQKAYVANLVKRLEAKDNIN
jgi:hypothetical protein